MTSPLFSLGPVPLAAKDYWVCLLNNLRTSPQPPVMFSWMLQESPDSRVLRVLPSPRSPPIISLQLETDHTSFQLPSHNRTPYLSLATTLLVLSSLQIRLPSSLCLQQPE